MAQCSSSLPILELLSSSKERDEEFFIKVFNSLFESREKEISKGPMLAFIVFCVEDDVKVRKSKNNVDQKL